LRGVESFSAVSFVDQATDQDFKLGAGAALIAWTLVVRGDVLVKGGAKRRRLRRSPTLDKNIATNRVLSKRSRPLSRRLLCA
jgi:hypothetical protein